MELLKYSKNPPDGLLVRKEDWRIEQVPQLCLGSALGSGRSVSHEGEAAGTIYGVCKVKLYYCLIF